MARNPVLYPTEWSNLCPATQVSEVDRFAELERKLQVLRFQMITGFKKDGQSIAELQNASLNIKPVSNVTNNVTNITNVINNVTNNVTPPISQQLNPPPSVGRAFLAGGFRGGVHGQIEKLTHATETVTTDQRRLITPRYRHTGSSSFSWGYWAGGVGAGPARLKSVEAYRYADERRTNKSLNLSVNTAYFRGGYSDKAAYWCCNWVDSGGGVFAVGATNSKIEKMVFQTESFSVLGAQLSRLVGGGNINQSATKIYYGSDWNLTRFIDTLTFSGDTTGQVSNLLSVARHQGGSFQSQTRGYFVGGIRTLGNPLTYNTTVDGITYATEAVALVTRAIAQKRSTDSDGTSAMRKGYWFGELEGTGTWVEGLDFASEQMKVISARLARGGKYVTAAGRP